MELFHTVMTDKSIRMVYNKDFKYLSSFYIDIIIILRIIKHQNVVF